MDLEVHGEQREKTAREEKGRIDNNQRESLCGRLTMSWLENKSNTTTNHSPYIQTVQIF